MTIAVGGMLNTIHTLQIEVDTLYLVVGLLCFTLTFGPQPLIDIFSDPSAFLLFVCASSLYSRE